MVQKLYFEKRKSILLSFFGTLCHKQQMFKLNALDLYSRKKEMIPEGTHSEKF